MAMLKFPYRKVEAEVEEALLPMGNSEGSIRPMRKTSVLRAGGRRRRVLWSIGGLSIALLLFLLLRRRGQTPDDADLSLPPNYTSLRQRLATLPQHNLSLPYPEGSGGRYVKFSCQIEYLGWNNVLNELLMNAHLAYRSNRAYVFMQYTWKDSYYPWSKNLVLQHPARTPLAALMSGPATGGEWPEGVRAVTGNQALKPPRAVSNEYFDLVCPPSRRRIIFTSDVKPWGRFDTNSKPGREIFDHWLSLLTDRAALDKATANHQEPGAVEDDSCIEIVSSSREEDTVPQVFDLWLWGSDRVLSLWEEFKASPIASTGVGTSPIVERCIQRNIHLFSRHSRETLDSSGRKTSSAVIPGKSPLDTTLAIHIRRGDFKQACQGLADWNSTFYSWNQLQFLPDHFIPPLYPERGKATEANLQIYLKRCLPDDDLIMKKVEDSRRDWETEMGYGPHSTSGNAKSDHYLETVFLLTNERDLAWLDKLKSHLLSSEGGWKNVIISSMEIVYGDAQEKDVGMAVDMELGMRAAVFIGNGFSSFTSNIVHRRLVDGKAPISNRFF